MAGESKRLARGLALVGFVIGLCCLATWWYLDRYNPFHLPMAEQGVEMAAPYYSAPPLYWAMERAIFVLCPGLVIGIAAMDMGRTAAWVVWIIAVLLNVPIYYLLGKGLEQLVRWVRGNRS